MSGMPLDALRPYWTGACDVFAVALHDATGWPLALIVGRHRDPTVPAPWPEDEQWQDEPAHAVCCCADGTLADARGRRSAAAVCAEAGFLGGSPTTVVVRPVTRDEALETFTMEPVDADALAEAGRVVAALLAVDYWTCPTPPAASGTTRPVH